MAVAPPAPASPPLSLRRLTPTRPIGKERSALWLAATGAVAIASSAIFIRLAGASPVTAAVFRTLYALPPLAVLALLEHRRHRTVTGPHSGRAATVAGGFFAAGLIFWHHAIFAVGAGIGTVLPNAQVVFVALIGWVLLGERPSRRIMAVLPLVLAGFLLISGGFERHAYGRQPMQGVAFGLLTALAYAGFLLTLRRAHPDRRHVARPVFAFTASAAAVASLVGLAGGGLDLAPGWRATGWLIGVALVSQVAGWMLISVAMPKLPMTLTSVVLTLQPVAAVLLALVVLGEVPSALQFAGMAAIVSAVVIASGGRAAEPARAAEAIAQRPRCVCRDGGVCRPSAACAQ